MRVFGGIFEKLSAGFRDLTRFISQKYIPRFIDLILSILSWIAAFAGNAAPRKGGGRHERDRSVAGSAAMAAIGALGVLLATAPAAQAVRAAECAQQRGGFSPQS